MTTSFFKAVFICSALVLGAPATAATYDIDAQNSSDVFKDRSGANGWWTMINREVNLNGQYRNGTVRAGMFRLTENLPGPKDRDFLAFCLSPELWLNLKVDYAAGSPLAAQIRGALGALSRHAFGQVTDALTAGAFQIAVWEIVSDQGRYDLSHGNIRFSAQDRHGHGALQLASTWLAKIESGKWAASTSGVRYHKATKSSQDLMEIAPVPLPASGLMLFSAVLGGMGLRRWRRVQPR